MDKLWPEFDKDDLDELFGVRESPASFWFDRRPERRRPGLRRQVRDHSDAHATVDVDATTGEVITLNDEFNGCEYLVGGRRSAHGHHLLEHHFKGFGLHVSQDRCVDGCWCDGTESNAVPRHLFRPDRIHRHEAGLGRGVVGLTHVSMARDAADVDHHGGSKLVIDDSAAQLAGTEKWPVRLPSLLPAA